MKMRRSHIIALGATIVIALVVGYFSSGLFGGGHCGGFILNAPNCNPGFRCALKPIADLGGDCVPFWTK